MTSGNKWLLLAAFDLETARKRVAANIWLGLNSLEPADSWASGGGQLLLGGLAAGATTRGQRMCDRQVAAGSARAARRLRGAGGKEKFGGLRLNSNETNKLAGEQQVSSGGEGETGGRARKAFVGGE